MNWLIAFLVLVLLTTGVLVAFVVADDGPHQTNVIYSPMPDLPKPTLPERE